MLLGATNGGVEGNAFAQWRPAPTGLTFRAGAGLGTSLNNNDPVTGAAFPLLQLANALHNQLTSIDLDQRDPITNALSGVTLPFIAPFTTATQMWIGSGNAPHGLAEAFAAISEVINARNAAFPNEFSWRAEVWGSRLAILNTAGDDNAILGAPFGFGGGAGNATAAAFDQNVRTYSFGGSGTAGRQTGSSAGNDGNPPKATDYTAAYEIARSDIDLFNLLVLPPDANPAIGAELEKLWPEASAFCASERAFLIMDPPPSWGDTQAASSGVNALRVGLTKDHSAVYFPRLRLVEKGLEQVVGPAGAMAGLFARIDGTRGVWKAPAGSEADLRGIAGIDVTMSDLQNGQINPTGVNAIRVFPEGVVSWGARTMDGADAFASEYKYVPIRRLALFLEESLYRGLKWAVFEPNDEPLWSQIRLNVGAFMQDLFRKGAFAGSKPSDAYFVKCDRETTTANDQNLGIVNIWVGFAPLKPAEFVVLYLQQIAQKLAS
jgi:phage tail sheath protein FI